jgi:hypothetical protein
MTSIEAYQLFSALRLHFQGKYDFIKYKGRMNPKAIQVGWLKTKSKHQFNKLSKHSDPKGLIISNLLINDQIWINNLSQEIYFKWKKHIDALSYNFEQELNYVDQRIFDDNFIASHNNHPPLLHNFLRGNISFETLIILNDLLKFTGYWNKKMKGDPIWEEVYRKMVCYKPFVQYNEDIIKGILLRKVSH